MPVVRDLLARKGSDVVSLPPTASVLAAAQLMNERHIGAIVVLESGLLVGIFTERDVLRRVVATGEPPTETLLSTVMTTSLVTCSVEAKLEDCASIMTTRRVRHMPVVDDNGTVVGLLSIGDVVAQRVWEQEHEIEALSRYIFDIR